MMSLAVIVKFLMWPKHSSSFHWNTSPATVIPNGMTVNLYLPISVLNIVRQEEASSSVWCQYPFLQSHMVSMQASASMWEMSSSVQK